MAGLQRSAVSFRRQGSSGFVWDDRFLSEAINKAANSNQAEQNQDKDEPLETNKDLHAPPPPPPPINTTVVERSRSNGGGRGYRTGKVSPAIEPPSPKLSACGCCGAFGKTGHKGGHPTKKPGKHRSR